MLATNQIFSITIMLAALTAAVIIAIKTPKKSWFKPAEKSTKNPNEWAPVYSWKEKFKLIGLNLCWVLPVYLLTRYLINFYGDINLLCHQALGINYYIWHLVGMLLMITLIFLAMVVYAFLYWRKVYLQAQFPLFGQKVLRPQKIITGNRAKRRAKWSMIALVVLGISFIVCLIMLGILMLDLDVSKAVAAKC